MENKNLTGYPSIDKPWLKYYSEEAINTPLPECSVYEYMARNNRQEPHRIALDYFDRKITYGELLANIDRAANAFYALGIREGDVVAGIAPSFPEIIYSFYALNKIGAVSDWFDPRTSPDIILKELRETKAKAVILMDEFAALFQGRDLGVETVIIVSAKDSLPMPAKLLMTLKKQPKVEIPHYTWKSFLTLGQNVQAELPQGDVAHLPALMEHTGGTTGNPKAVLFANQNINMNPHQFGIGFREMYSRNSVHLSMGFPFVTYSLVGSICVPFSIGMEVVLCFDLNCENVAKAILNKHCTAMQNTPSTWEQIKGSAMMDGKDLSFVKNPIVGADKLSAEEEKSINDFFAAHNSSTKILKGYGMTETCSGVAMEPSNQIYKSGSVGIPFLNTTIAIFDPETCEELPYGQEGEVCISSAALMVGYYNRPEETAKVLRKHADGRIWMHSGDLGYMDEDGFLFIVGRLKRMLINHVGFKIFAPQVEQVISTCEDVEKCCVVGAPDTEHGSGQVAVAYVIPKRGVTANAEKIEAVCKAALPEYAVPHKFVFVDELPYTGAGKVDYRALEERAKAEAVVNGK